MNVPRRSDLVRTEAPLPNELKLRHWPKFVEMLRTVRRQPVTAITDGAGLCRALIVRSRAVKRSGVCGGPSWREGFEMSASQRLALEPACAIYSRTPRLVYPTTALDG